MIRFSNLLDIDNLCEPFKVFRVVRQQRGNAIGFHRGDDIGIVHLFAAELVVGQQLQELFGDSGCVVCDLEAIFKIPYSFLPRQVLKAGKKSAGVYLRR